MKNMFKKTLIAAALASVSTGALAADVSVGGVFTSTEYLNAADQSAQVTNYSALQVKLGANYTQNDLIRLTFTGVSLDTDNLKPSVSSAAATAGGDPIITLGLLGSEEVDGNTVVTYRVTDVNGDTFDSDADPADAITLDFTPAGGLKFDAKKIGGNVNVTFSAETNTGLALDTSTSRPGRLDSDGDPIGGSHTGRLVTRATQYALISAASNLMGKPFDEVIDVAQSRYQFEDTAGAQSIFHTFGLYTSTSNQTALLFANSLSGATYAATTNSAEYTVSGDFSWLLDEDGEYDSSVATVTTGCGAFEVDANSLTFDCDNATLQADVQITPASNNDVVIPDGSFSVSGVINYTAAGNARTKTLSAGIGQWTLNGSDVHVPYMPYGANISQILVVTNTSNQTGDITVTAIDEAGNEYDLGVVGVSEAGTTKRITGQVWNALNDAGLDLMGSTQRLSLRIVTNAPDGDVTVYSAYNVGGTGARLVVNDSNGK